MNIKNLKEILILIFLLIISNSPAKSENLISFEINDAIENPEKFESINNRFYGLFVFEFEGNRLCSKKIHKKNRCISIDIPCDDNLKKCLESYDYIKKFNNKTIEVEGTIGKIDNFLFFEVNPYSFKIKNTKSIKNTSNN